VERRARVRLARGFAAAALVAVAWAVVPIRAVPAETSGIIDLHAHVAGIGAGDSGCLVSDTLRGNVRFRWYLWAMGVDLDELGAEGDAIVFARLAAAVAESERVERAVVLAMDGVVDAAGELDRTATEMYVPNEYVLENVRKYPELLFGASVHPRRRDALARLDWARANGAVLVKWLPAVMDIDPADPAYAAYYAKLVELRLPLLVHVGAEAAFARANNALGDPRRLERALEAGVTVIAAHLATTGEIDGVENFDRLLPMFERWPNLYADISSLTQINKLGYLRRALARPGVAERLVYGSDWPLQYLPVVSPWYHLPQISFRGVRAVRAESNTWDRDVVLKQQMGVPNAVFTRGATLLPRAP
jgi:uncharacterized protein